MSEPNTRIDESMPSPRLGPAAPFIPLQLRLCAGGPNLRRVPRPAAPTADPISPDPCFHGGASSPGVRTHCPNGALNVRQTLISDGASNVRRTPRSTIPRGHPAGVASLVLTLYPNSPLAPHTHLPLRPASLREPRKTSDRLSHGIVTPFNCRQSFPRCRLYSLGTRSSPR